MSIAIMQPYIFPYIGYFQLVYASKTFVFYDDVNFINRGWINRNRILLNGKDHVFTVSCKDASQNKLIKDIEVLNDAKALQKTVTTIATAYKKAPHFQAVMPIIEQVLQFREGLTIADMAIESVTAICNYLNVERVFKASSREYNNQELKKADRLIDICHVEGIEHYINAPGGKEIYTKEYFQEQRVKLDFLMSEKQEYAQFKNEFVPWLSIIDIVMFVDKKAILEHILPAYHLD